MSEVPSVLAALGAFTAFWLGCSVGRFKGRSEAFITAYILIKGFSRRMGLKYPDMLDDFKRYIEDMSARD